MTKAPTMTAEYQPRTPERLIEMLRAQSEQPRSWQREAASTIEYLLLRLAANPADEETIPVPKAALDWLNGGAPDADGKWFGECIPQSDVTPKRAYWWRSKFRSMIPALSTTGEPKR
jgi:hypothetical protein